MTVRSALLASCTMILVTLSAWYRPTVTSSTGAMTPPVVTAGWDTILMAYPRSEPTATLLADGRVLVTGRDFSNPNPLDSIATTEIYDPSTKTFSRGPQFFSRRMSFPAAPIPEGVLIGVGMGVSVIDLARNAVRSVASMTDGRNDYTITPLHDSTFLLVGGGHRGTYTTAEIYDPRTGRLVRTGDALVTRFGCPATLLQDGSFLLMGGTSSADATYNKSIADAEIYDPAAHSFRRTGSMTRPRSGHTSTLLSDGRVLVTGGYDDRRITATAELYDPGSGVFRAVAPMRVPRILHAAVLLSDGRVLIMGGARGNVILRSAEVFDPALERFLETEPMVAPRERHSATLLRTGEVLVVGGNGSAKTAEVFDLGR